MSGDALNRVKHRSPVLRSFRLALRMPSMVDEMLAASDLPDPCAALVRRVVARTRLWQREKAEVAHELIDHMHDGLRAELTPGQIVEQFGDPVAAAKLIRRAKRRQRHPLMRAWTAAVKLTVFSPLILLGLYGLLWVRFHAGEPTISRDFVSMIGSRWPEAGPGRPPNEVYELARIRWNDIAFALDERAADALRDSDWSTSPAADLPSLDPAHPMYREVTEAFLGYAPELAGVSAAARRTSHGTPLAAEIHYPETYTDRTVDPEDRLYTHEPFPDNPANQPAMWNVLLPHLGSMRTCAKLLAFDARLALDAGDTELYMDRTGSMLDLARQASGDGIVISSLVAIAIHDFVVVEVNRSLGDHAELFGQDQITRLAHMLDASADAVLAMEFEFERYGAQDVLQRSFTSNGSGGGRLINEAYGNIVDFGAADLGVVPDLSAPSTGTRVLAPIAALFVAGREAQYRMIDEQLRAAETVLAAGPSAMPEALAVRAALEDRFASPFQRLRYLVAATHCLGIDHVLGTVFKSRARTDATLVALACLSYERNHGSRPESIGDLVPRYLPRVPEDPFQPGAGLRLRTDGGIVLIYSVGQDGADDSGRPLLEADGDRACHTFEARWAGERQTATGDWVLFPPTE